MSGVHRNRSDAQDEKAGRSGGQAWCCGVVAVVNLSVARAECRGLAKNRKIRRSVALGEHGPSSATRNTALLVRSRSDWLRRRVVAAGGRGGSLCNACRGEGRGRTEERRQDAEEQQGCDRFGPEL